MWTIVLIMAARSTSTATEEGAAYTDVGTIIGLLFLNPTTALLGDTAHWVLRRFGMSPSQAAAWVCGVATIAAAVIGFGIWNAAVT